MVAKSCRECGAIGLALCEDCSAGYERQRKRPSASARGYDAEYRRNRLVVLDQAKRGKPCVICNRGFSDGELVTAEHIVPLRKDGRNAKSNLGPAHARCNFAWNRSFRP